MRGYQGPESGFSGHFPGCMYSIDALTFQFIDLHYLSLSTDLNVVHSHCMLQSNVTNSSHSKIHPMYNSKTACPDKAEILEANC